MRAHLSKLNISGYVENNLFIWLVSIVGSIIILTDSYAVEPSNQPSVAIKISNGSHNDAMILEVGIHTIMDRMD